MLNFLKRFYTFRDSVNFVYAEPYRNYGSTVLRGEQLSKLARKYIDKDIRFTSLDYKYESCILFLTKWAVYSLKETDFERLKTHRNILVFDVLDGLPPDNKIEFADVFIACSKTIEERYKNILPKNKKVFLVDHYIDLRLPKIKNRKRLTELRIGYFGELINTLDTPKIRQKVDFIPVSTVSQNNEWFKSLRDYNLHYAIRQKRKVYPNKPFLKGFTAAYCGANILVQDSEKEAVRWLGKSYPYLLKGGATEKKVLKVLTYIEKSYGSDEWKRGLKIMRRIKEKLSEKLIAKELTKVFDYCQKTVNIN